MRKDLEIAIASGESPLVKVTRRNNTNSHGIKVLSCFDALIGL